MTEQHRREETAAAWIERAGFRLAECEAELRKRPGSPKLVARLERYRDLLVELRGLADVSRRGVPAAIDEIDGELIALKTRLEDLARELVRAREEWKALKLRWGIEADRAMREREERGEPPGRAPALDFRIPPPPPDADAESRAAFEILREVLP